MHIIKILEKNSKFEKTITSSFIQRSSCKNLLTPILIALQLTYLCMKTSNIYSEHSDIHTSIIFFILTYLIEIQYMYAIIQRPSILSVLTAYIIQSELTHLGFEASIFNTKKMIGHGNSMPISDDHRLLEVFQNFASLFIWRPPNPSELTQIKIHMELTYLGSDASISVYNILCTLKRLLFYLI